MATLPVITIDPQNGGTVTPQELSRDISSGSDLYLIAATAIPSKGYVFSSWEISGKIINRDGGVRDTFTERDLNKSNDGRTVEFYIGNTGVGSNPDYYKTPWRYSYDKFIAHFASAVGNTILRNSAGKILRNSAGKILRG